VIDLVAVYAVANRGWLSGGYADPELRPDLLQGLPNRPEIDVGDDEVRDALMDAAMNVRANIDQPWSVSSGIGGTKAMCSTYQSRW
jgi:hypothetical protein